MDIDDGIILVERTFWPDREIALLNFLPVALVHYRARPVVYEMYPYKRGSILAKKIKHFFSTLNWIAPSKYHLVTGLINNINPEHQNILKSLRSATLTKQEFQHLSYRNIRYGDLVYDHYLRRHRKETLNLEDPTLALFVREFLGYIDQFYKLFEASNVKAVVVSHSIYHFAIPARIAIKKRIPAYLVDLERLCRLDETSPFGYPSEWLSLKSEFESIKNLDKSKALQKGKGIVEARLDGDKASLGLPRGIHEPIVPNISQEIIGDPRPKVLIALHDFYDAVHSLGDAFYPDFYEWIIDLFRMSKGSKLLWLVKPHPFELRPTSELLTSLTKEYPHIKIIPKDYNLTKLAQMGLKYCLTVHGNVASELPALDVIVINASLNNPHANYEFSITPSNLQEYRKIIENLSTLRFNVNKEDLYLYNYMRFANNLLSWCVSDRNAFVSKMGTLRELQPEDTFSWYFESGQSKYISCVRGAVSKFIGSADARMLRSHFEENCSDCRGNCKFLMKDSAISA